jgi:hypothetical protein
MGDAALVLAEAQAGTNTILMELMRVMRSNQVDLMDMVSFFRYHAP